VSDEDHELVQLEVNNRKERLVHVRYFLEVITCYQKNFRSIADIHLLNIFLEMRPEMANFALYFGENPRIFFPSKISHKSKFMFKNLLGADLGDNPDGRYIVLSEGNWPLYKNILNKACSVQ